MINFTADTSDRPTIGQKLNERIQRLRRELRHMEKLEQRLASEAALGCFGEVIYEECVTAEPEQVCEDARPTRTDRAGNAVGPRSAAEAFAFQDQVANPGMRSAGGPAPTGNGGPATGRCGGAEVPRSAAELISGSNYDHGPDMRLACYRAIPVIQTESARLTAAQDLYKWVSGG